MKEAIRCTLSACVCTLPVFAVVGWYVWRNLEYLTVIIFYPFAPFVKHGD